MFGPILAWIRKQIGQTSDAASATGSAHAKLASILASILPARNYASDTLQHSADTERSTTSGTYVKKKEIYIVNTGIIRIKFDGKSLDNMGSRAFKGKIYIDDVAAGTEQTNATDSYVTYSENLYVKAGQKVSLYIYAVDTNYAVYCRNFRIYYDTDYAGGGVITD